MSYCEGGGGSPGKGAARSYPVSTPNHRTSSVSLPELCAAMRIPVPPDAELDTERFPCILAYAGCRLHTMGERSHAFLDRTRLPALPKPFTRDQLLARVAECIGVAEQ